MKDLDILEFRLAEKDLGVMKVEWHCFDGIDADVTKFVTSELTSRGLASDLFKVINY